VYAMPYCIHSESKFILSIILLFSLALSFLLHALDFLKIEFLSEKWKNLIRKLLHYYGNHQAGGWMMINIWILARN
jgi:hypothetical protein